MWYCAAGHAWPVLAWEKEGRFGYTATVTVQEEDSLWKLANALYGDGHFWTQIYEENKERIGGDANLILPGTDLEITVNAPPADRRISKKKAGSSICRFMQSKRLREQ